jgi:ribosomal protein S18 acetylase RimI-like enzyme
VYTSFPAELVRRAHLNLETQLRLVAGAAPGGGVKDIEGVALLASGLPYALFNRMLVIDPPAAPPTALGRAREFFRELALPWSVCAAPGAIASIEASAIAAGLTRLGPQPMMVLEARHAVSIQAEGLAIRTCVTDADAGVFVRVTARGFSSPRIVFDAYCRPGVIDSPAVRHFVGYLADEPIAAATLVNAHGIAGIYNVTTLKRFRRRGFGAAMTMHAARAGFAAGCDASALQASAMGFKVYEELGFRHACDYTIWAPPG